MYSKPVSSPCVDFSGSIPHHYEEYLGPMFFEPYAIEVAKRIKETPVHLALELACGTGRVTRHLRNVLPENAKLIASDISPDMLTVAKEKSGASNIDWQIINAQELPFDSTTIDIVVCCFGYMLVPDKPRAFAEAYRVLKTGGMLLLTTWDRLEYNAASHIYRTIAREYLTDPIPEIYTLPFSMHDDADIRKDLQQAGFSKITIERVGKVSASPSAREAAHGLTSGGSLYNEIMKRNPAWVEEIKEAVEKELAEKFGASPTNAPMSALITQAWK